KFDLTLMMGEGSTSIQCWLEYNTELFDEASALGMLHHFKTLLQQVARNPEARIDAIPWLSAAERSALLSGWGSDEATLQPKQTVSALIAAHAERNPSALALVSDGTKFTYQELNQSTSGLALRLHEAGAESAARIGICLERGIDQVTAALAVMKAGGIFVPLDIDEAQERLRYMLADAGVSAIITEEKFRERFGSSPNIQLIFAAEESATK